MVLKKLIFQNKYVELETHPPFMDKSILNFHFDYWKISLTVRADGADPPPPFSVSLTVKYPFFTPRHTVRAEGAAALPLRSA